MKNVNVFRLLSIPTAFLIAMFVVGFEAWNYNPATMENGQRAAILVFTLIFTLALNVIISILNGELK